MSSVRRENNSDKILSVLKEISSKEVRTGFFESAKYTDGTPIAYVASIQELGYGPIPPRPFMRPAESANKEKWEKLLAMNIKKAIDGEMTADFALEQVGMVVVGDIRKAIKAVTAPPLSPLTLLIRKHKKNPDAEKVGGKLVGQLHEKAYGQMGPAPKKDKSSSLSGVSTKPLVDTGLMLQSVTSVVVEKGK